MFSGELEEIEHELEVLVMIGILEPHERDDLLPRLKRFKNIRDNTKWGRKKYRPKADEPT